MHTHTAQQKNQQTQPTTVFAKRFASQIQVPSVLWVVSRLPAVQSMSQPLCCILQQSA